MAEHSSMLHVRMDSQLKEEAGTALAAMGLTASDAVRILFSRIVAEQAFPLELKVPNAVTREAMSEAVSITEQHRTRFDNAGSMMAALDAGKE